MEKIVGYLKGKYHKANKYRPVVEKFIKRKYGKNPFRDQTVDLMAIMLAENVEQFGTQKSPLRQVLESHGLIPQVPPMEVGMGTLGDVNLNSADLIAHPVRIAMHVVTKTFALNLVPIIPVDRTIAVIPFVEAVYGGGDDINPEHLFIIKLNKHYVDDTGLAFGDNNDAFWKLMKTGDVVEFGIIDNATPPNRTPYLTTRYVGYHEVTGEVILYVESFNQASAQTLASVFNVLNNPGANNTAYILHKDISGNALNIQVDELRRGTTAVADQYGAWNFDLGFDAVESQRNHIVGWTTFLTGHAQGQWGQVGGTLMGHFIDYDEAVTMNLHKGLDRGDAEYSHGTKMKLRSSSKTIKTWVDFTEITTTPLMVQDLEKMHGLDVLAFMESQIINEIAQKINFSIIAHMYQLGLLNAQEATRTIGFDYQVIDLTGYSSTLTGPGNAQSALISSIEAISNAMVNVRSRIGSADFIICDPITASAIRSARTFQIYNWDIKVNKDGLYPIGNLNGMDVYVDPRMRIKTEDINGTPEQVGTIILGSYAGDPPDIEPGLKMFPYSFAYLVERVSESMAPVFRVYSRYAIDTIGFYPHTRYWTAKVIGIQRAVGRE